VWSVFPNLTRQFWHILPFPIVSSIIEGINVTNGLLRFPMLFGSLAFPECCRTSSERTANMAATQACLRGEAKLPPCFNA
jgi:hypothetical protein